MDDDRVIPRGFLVDEEYLSEFIWNGVESESELLQQMEDNDELTFDEFEYRVNVYVQVRVSVRGNIRTMHYEGTFEQIIEELKEARAYYDACYGVDDSDEGRFAPTSWAYRVLNPWYGYGIDYVEMLIKNNDIRFVNYTKSTSKCMEIASIKSQEPSLRNKTAKELNDHTLMKNSNRYLDDDKRFMIGKYYKKHVRIVSSKKKLFEINREEFDEDIVLFARGKHLGYVTFDFEKTIEEEGNRAPKSIALEPIYGAVAIDCEFSFDKENDILISRDPTLVCMYGTMWINNKPKTIRKVFKSVGNTLSYLTNFKKRIYVYSHNGGRVEHRFIYKNLVKVQKYGEKQGYLELARTKGNQFKNVPYKNVEFLDSFLFMPDSLDRLAEGYGIGKTKRHAEWERANKTKRVWKNDEWVYEFDKDEWYRNKIWSADDSEDVEYCMGDCEILYRLLVQYNEIIKDLVICNHGVFPDGSKWVLTQSSVSSVGKQTIINTHPNIVNNPRQKAYYSKTYYGGRCEMYRKGFVRSTEEKVIVSMDINSSYPYQMTHQLPGRTVNELTPDSKVTLDRCEGMWLAWVEISYKEKYSKPPLAILDDYYLIFPNLENPTLTCLWHFEYEAFKNNIIVHKIKRVFFFEPIDISDFIMKLYAIKKNAEDKAVRSVSKMLMNATYGGLAIKQFQEQKVIAKSFERYMKKHHIQIKCYHERMFEDYTLLTYEKLINAKVAFQTASYVTAKGRLQQWKMGNYVESIGGEWLYGDTDSVIVLVDRDKTDKLKAFVGNEIGEWDYEEHSAAYFKGLKFYCLDQKVVAKGINKKILKNMSMMHILGEETVVENERWTVDEKARIIIKNSEFIYGDRYGKGYHDKEDYEALNR